MTDVKDFSFTPPKPRFVVLKIIVVFILSLIFCFIGWLVMLIFLFFCSLGLLDFFLAKTFKINSLGITYSSFLKPNRDIKWSDIVHIKYVVGKYKGSSDWVKVDYFYVTLNSGAVEGFSFFKVDSNIVTEILSHYSDKYNIGYNVFD